MEFNNIGHLRDFLDSQAYSILSQALEDKLFILREQCSYEEYEDLCNNYDIRVERKIGLLNSISSLSVAQYLALSQDLALNKQQMKDLEAKTPELSDLDSAPPTPADYVEGGRGTKAFTTSQQKK